MTADVSGAAITYANTVTTAVVASPAPTTTTFSVTPAGGATLTVGRTVTVNGSVTPNNIATIVSITTDAIVVTPPLAVVPATGNSVVMTGSIPLTGMKALLVTTGMKTVDLRGDNTFLDTDTVLQTLQFDVDLAKVSLDVMSIMMGGTITDTGTTPSQLSTWNLLTQPSFNYFKLEARCFTTDLINGDLHITCSKMKAADAPIPGFVEEDYFYPKIKCKAVPPVSGSLSNWVTIALNETALPCL
jgi:hypothetical protein